MKLILDTETTRQKHRVTGKDDPSPYNPNNKLVTVQYRIVGGDKVLYPFYHAENKNAVENHKLVQAVLDKTTVLIGQNLKFDISWLINCGFVLPEGLVLHDTMIFEYICNKGNKGPLGLAALAEKYKLPLKLDILQDYWGKGINTDEIPLAELTEYALQDIDTTEALYNLQIKRLEEDKDIQFMQPAIKLTNEALEVIVEMERNGCSIDFTALSSVEQEYITELKALDREIYAKINELMGDTPINTSSSGDMSQLLYSFEIKDKKVWKDIFQIGTSERNSVKKKKYPKRMGSEELAEVIEKNTIPVFKTRAEQCSTCHGHKKIRKIKIDGTLFKKENICPSCNGLGLIYNILKEPAGLGLVPVSSDFAVIQGFAADRKAFDQYLSRESLSEETKAFLRALSRQSAIQTYLTTFVEGIRTHARENGFLHTNFNQCITATGRLSSSNPNFQNLPRGSTFPVRKAIKSRFKEGKILEVDFAGLEYRVAVMLANCKVGLDSITSGKDRHQVTAEIIYGRKKETYSKEEWKQVRQNAKAHTFKPLYFGQSGTPDEKKYYKAFIEEHAGIKKWHNNLIQEALDYKQIRTPTGRIFAFPNVKRGYDGKVKGSTQIVNYPVQSVATADMIWIVVVDIYREMKRLGLESKLMFQIHDAVVADVHPKEVEIMIELFKKAFDKTHELLYNRYNYKTQVPIGYEMSMGDNWNDKKEVA